MTNAPAAARREGAWLLGRTRTAVPCPNRTITAKLIRRGAACPPRRSLSEVNPLTIEVRGLTHGIQVSVCLCLKANAYHLPPGFAAAVLLRGQSAQVNHAGCGGELDLVPTVLEERSDFWQH